VSGPAGSLNLEGFATIAPEWHALAADNFATHIYSLELSYHR
jgi:hypothetical protein